VTVGGITMTPDTSYSTQSTTKRLKSTPGSFRTQESHLERGPHFFPSNVSFILLSLEPCFSCLPVSVELDPRPELFSSLGSSVMLSFG
jgi:hypothetical protein